jgi:hypothetical protein
MVDVRKNFRLRWFNVDYDSALHTRNKYVYIFVRLAFSALSSLHTALPSPDHAFTRPSRQQKKQETQQLLNGAVISLYPKTELMP